MCVAVRDDDGPGAYRGMPRCARTIAVLLGGRWARRSQPLTAPAATPSIMCF